VHIFTSTSQNFEHCINPKHIHNVYKQCDDLDLYSVSA